MPNGSEKTKVTLTATSVIELSQKNINFAKDIHDRLNGLRLKIAGRVDPKELCDQSKEKEPESFLEIIQSHEREKANILSSINDEIEFIINAYL